MKNYRIFIVCLFAILVFGFVSYLSATERFVICEEIYGET
jgi:hypothetical protein